MANKEHQRLSDSYVRKLPLAEHEYFEWDRDLSGFGVRVLPSGRKVFVFQARKRDSKKQFRRRVGLFGQLTADEARTEARKYLCAIATGEFETKKRSREVLFKAFVDEWASGRALTNRRNERLRKSVQIANDLRNLKHHVLPVLAGKFVHEITKTDIRSVMALARTVRKHPGGDKRKGRGYRGMIGGPGACKRVLRTLKSIFAHAVDEELRDDNPVVGIPIPVEEAPKYRFSLDQLRRIVSGIEEARRDGLNPKSLDIMLLLAYTAARPGEIAELKWSEVDIEQRKLRLVDAKEGPSDRTLSDAAIDVLLRQTRRDGNPFVFPGRNRRKPVHHQATGDHWRELRAKLGLPMDAELYTFRRSFATLLTEDGVALHVIADIMGHEQVETTKRYAGGSFDQGKRAANAFSAALHAPASVAAA